MLAFAFAFAATALPAAPSASVTCADGPASCDSAWPSTPSTTTATDDDGPREYATPVEIDCPAPPQPPAVAASGECSEPPVNLWFRVSRFPESELPAGRLSPGTARRAHGANVVTGGLPDVGFLQKLNIQPIALHALPALYPTASRRRDEGRTQILPARALAPPDRPPRTA
jgi:hypothetical protein